MHIRISWGVCRRNADATPRDFSLIGRAERLAWSSTRETVVLVRSFVISGFQSRTSSGSRHHWAVGRYLWAWVSFLSHLVAALIRDSEPHETVLLNLAKWCVMLVFTLLNPWRNCWVFNTLPLLPDSQVPHEVSLIRLDPNGGPTPINAHCPESFLHLESDEQALGLWICPVTFLMSFLWS